MTTPPDAAVCSAAPGAGLETLKRDYLDALLRGSKDEATRLVLGAASAEVRDLYLHVFQPAQYEIGRLWQDGKISVGTEHLATAVTQSVMSILYPRLFNAVRLGRRLLGACTPGELHEIGLRMVCDFFEMEGWDTFYLGANTPVQGIVEAEILHRADVLAISATSVNGFEKVREIVHAARKAPGGAALRILVGGSAFSVEGCRDVGADGFAIDAQTAVEPAHRLLDLAPPTRRAAVAVPPAPPSTQSQPDRFAPSPPVELSNQDLLTRFSILHNENINAQRELTRQRAEVTRLAAEKNELIAMLAHDPRSPLNVVLVCSKLLEKSELSPEKHAEIMADIQAALVRHRHQAPAKP